MNTRIIAASLLALACTSFATASHADEPCKHTAEQNKQIVTRFYNALMQGDVATLQANGRPDYRQHNPNYGDTLQGLIDMIHSRAARAPDAPPIAPLVFIRVVAEGDFVVMLRRMGPSPGVDPTPEAERANVDFFRVQDCKVAEHWDYTETFPRGNIVPKNNNGRF